MAIKFLTRPQSPGGNLYLDDHGDASNTTVAFSTAGTKSDISTDSTLATLFGVLKKWYASFGAAAWMGTGTSAGTVATGNHKHPVVMVGLTTSATLALTHAECCIRMSNSAAATITVPTNASVEFPIGTQIVITQESTGTVTLAPVSGTVTINSKDAKLKIGGQYSAVTLLKKDTNLWSLWGDLA